MRTAARWAALVVVTALLAVLPAPAASAATLGPPSGLTVIVASTSVAFGQGRVTASWSAVTGALGYAVSARAGGVVVASTTVSAPLTSGTVTGLTGGVTYDLVVQTANSDGFGAASSPVQATALTVPAAPAVGTPTASGGSTTVEWGAPNNGGSTITSYTVTQVPTSTVVPDLTTTSHTFSGTDNVSAADYTVTATNAVGTSSSGEATSTTPSAPRALAATVAASAITATWMAPASTGGSAVTGYTATLSSGGNVLSSQSVASLTAGFTGIAAGTYQLQVTAANRSGAGLPASLTVTVAADGTGSSDSGGSTGSSGGSTGGTAGSTGSTTGSKPTGESSGSTGGTSTTTPSAPPSVRPSGVLPGRIVATAGTRETVGLTKAVNVVPKQLLVRATSSKGKPTVLKARFVRKGSTVTVSFTVPRTPGTYWIQVMQRTATGLAQVAKSRLVVQGR
jgi:hypothetical protein